MATFVLIPGAWLGAWAWEPVTERLLARGHDVHALTLPGLAERHGERPNDLAAHVADVVRMLDTADLRDVILVAHSYAGAVAAGVEATLADRLASVVHVASAPPPAGLSLFDMMGPDAEAGMRAMAAATGDPDFLPFPDDATLSMFYPNAGLDAATLRAVRRRTTSHPIAAFAGRMPVGGVPAPDLPRVCIHSTGDGAPIIPTGTPGWRHVELHTGHWPMFTMPAGLSDAIATAAEVE